MQVIQKIKQVLLHRSLMPGSSDPGSGNRLRCSRNTYIKNQRNIRIIGSVSLVILFALTAFTLRPVSIETSSVEATANPATTTLTIAASGNAAILDITPSSTSGTFASSDTTDTSLGFSVTTDNITGYNLSIRHASATSPAPLVNEALSLNLDSLETSVTESQFSTSAYVGHYGYKPSMLNSEDNSNYIPAPTTTPTPINVTQCANNTTNCNTANDNYTIALGANIDYTKSAGTYTNTFILTAVANNVAYTINYLDNTSDSSISNLPATEPASIATASSFTLSSTQPTRTGYDFAGWCDGTVTHNATGNDTCSGATYSAGSTYSFASPSSTSTNVANLYAMWNVKTFTITLSKTDATAIVIDDTSYTGSSATLTYGNHTISGTYPSGYEFSSWATSDSTNLAITSTSSASTTITIYGAATLTLTGKSSMLAIQDITSSTCTTTAQDVYDKRDNEVYKIQKLADGKCWLLDNLRLGSTTLVQALSTSNTNMSSSVAFTLPASSSSGFTSYNTPMINTASANTATTSYGSGSGKIGVYYNYCAASAGTYCMASGSGSGNASYDVCPKGWRMPTGGSSGEYQALYTAYSSNASSFRTALSTPLSGYIYNSPAGDQDSRGRFWSSTYYSGNGMYDLIVTSSTVNPQLNHFRNYGLSVRCVLRSGTITDATNMQDVTSAQITNSAEGATTTLKDVRDNQDYTVAKINGNLWMTRNLAIGCNGTGSTYGSSVSSKSLTSTYSNVSSSWSTPAALLSTAANSSSASGYITAAMQCSSTYGAWYNYAAASAGTITGSSNNTADTYNICPKGWTLPTSTQISGITSQATAFSPVTGGYYSSGSLDSTGLGCWWSATAYLTEYRYYLLWDGSSLSTSKSIRGRRFSGFYVRCVRSS